LSTTAASSLTSVRPQRRVVSLIRPLRMPSHDGLHLRPEGPYLQMQTPDTLRNWCNGIGDLNPLFREYRSSSRPARRVSGTGCLASTPCFRKVHAGWPGSTLAGNARETMQSVSACRADTRVRSMKADIPGTVVQVADPIAPIAQGVRCCILKVGPLGTQVQTNHGLGIRNGLISDTTLRWGRTDVRRRSSCRAQDEGPPNYNAECIIYHVASRRTGARQTQFVRLPLSRRLPTGAAYCA